MPIVEGSGSMTAVADVSSQGASLFEAVGGMRAAASIGGPPPVAALNKIEQAMIDAIKQAQTEGITDSLVIAKRMKEAADKAASG